ncbi:interferon tau-11-like [Ovis canadensis]|uniref:interferon tau-11-like n=1 Tax=Ovis canadensis TaxID=37174 RepID=UPI003751444C
MQRIRSQSRLKDRADFRFPWKREMITPVQMTQGPCNHYLMLQQSFQLFTTEDSRATLEPGSEPETAGAHGRRQSVLFSRDFLPVKYFQGIHLYLRELEYSHFA